ncbi:hypothetical protein [Alicyclobacillus ferrooxydans]|uniref:hypothetical protein n=1 Tax=Alicyclobacillus ferrooxydans TaxID=471514 RepID=UPI0012EDA6DF|nr:hypothetical protein [Alicyclobacillus ferrooxydans]
MQEKKLNTTVLTVSAMFKRSFVPNHDVGKPKLKNPPDLDSLNSAEIAYVLALHSVDFKIGVPGLMMRQLLFDISWRRHMGYVHLGYGDVIKLRQVCTGVLSRTHFQMDVITNE